MKVVLLISHGSHSPKTKLEVQSLLHILKAECPNLWMAFAFLEIEEPNIPLGIDRCVQAGATEIVFLLNFLNAGKHVDQDIPQIMAEAKQKYPNVQFVMTQPIGQHPLIKNLFIDLISHPNP